jgi:hypothetical protein
MSLNLIMGARNGAKNERQEHDYYATHPQAVRDFLVAINKDRVELSKDIWECACGGGHMAEVLIEHGYDVYATDLVDRGYGAEFVNFLDLYDYGYYDGDIVTNPPYKYAKEFVEQAIRYIPEGNKVCMLLKIQFLEGKARKKLFEKYPPKYIYVYSERQQCALNGDFEKYKNGGKTQAYIWIIWEKGYTGETITRWI